MQLVEYEIKFYTSENYNIKAAIAARFNQTLKIRIYWYFTHSKSYRYVDVLQDLEHSCSHNYHSRIGMAPGSVNAKNERDKNYFINARKSQNGGSTSANE